MNDMSPPIPLPFGQSGQDVELFRLIRGGETARIREAFDAGADPEARERFGATPMLAAVENRRLDVIRLLVEAGADPDTPRLGMDEFTPLHSAAQRDNLETVLLLLELGADAAKRTWLTPIDWAVSQPVVQALAVAGGDPNARCPETGKAPLHRRACTGMVEPMRALLEAGADVSARDLLGRTPLHHVTLGHRRGDVAMAVALLLGAGADAEARDENGQTVLELALSRRDGIALRALARAGIRATASRGVSRPARGGQGGFPAGTGESGHAEALLDA